MSVYHEHIKILEWSYGISTEKFLTKVMSDKHEKFDKSYGRAALEF